MLLNSRGTESNRDPPADDIRQGHELLLAQRPSPKAPMTSPASRSAESATRRPPSPGDERVVDLARVRLVGADGHDGRVIGHERAVEQRLRAVVAQQRRPRRHQGVDAVGVPADHVDVLDRPHRADPLDVAVRLRPRPKTSRRRASGAARRRTASAETAGVRTLVSAIPSTSATGASVVASKTTQTPWMRGSPPTVTSLTTA